MSQLARKVITKGSGVGSLAIDVDHVVSLRIRQRRIMLGLTQQQMAVLIGVTYQQAHKYETGINRISAGRLYQIAKALGVDIEFFYESVDPERKKLSNSDDMVPQQRMLLELARNFTSISNRRHQDALCQLARVLSSRKSGNGTRKVDDKPHSNDDEAAGDQG